MHQIGQIELKHCIIFFQLLMQEPPSDTPFLMAKDLL